MHTHIHMGTYSHTDESSKHFFLLGFGSITVRFSNSELRSAAADIVLLTLSTCYSFPPSNAIFPGVSQSN